MELSGDFGARLPPGRSCEHGGHQLPQRPIHVHLRLHSRHSLSVRYEPWKQLGSLMKPYRFILVHTNSYLSLSVVPLQYAHEMEGLTCPSKEITLNNLHLSSDGLMEHELAVGTNEQMSLSWLPAFACQLTQLMFKSHSTSCCCCHAMGGKSFRCLQDQLDQLDQLTLQFLSFFSELNVS